MAATHLSSHLIRKAIQSFVMPLKNLLTKGKKSLLTVKLICPFHAEPIHFVMELSTRKVHIAGITPQFQGYQVEQIARNLTDYTDGFLKDKRYFIHDRDPLYTKKFQTTLESSGVKCVKLPPKSPDLNSYCERFVLSIKSECLNYLILSSVQQLDYAVNSYVAYYHHERIHQSLNRIIEPMHATDDDAEIVCIERLCGLLKSYHRLAA